MYRSLAAAILLTATAVYGAQAQTTEPREVRDFVAKATISNQLEIETSRLALDKAQSGEVKAFAQQMIDDHTKAGEKLRATVREIDANEMTRSLDGSHQDELDALSKKEGAEFDRTYVAGQVKLHDEAVALFADYAKTGTNPELKAFAQETLPVIERHREHVKSLR
jgi:putative membrane protein